MAVQDFLSSLPLIGGLFDDSQQKAQAELAKNQALWGSLETPTFNPYTPDKYQVAGQYDPAMMQAQTVQDDPAIRSQQLSVLNNMAGLAQNGLSDVDQAGFMKAREMGDQMTHSGTQAALQNANSRGMGGSGMEFALREMAGQQGATNAMNAGLDQAGQSAQMRAMYNQAFGSALGNLRNQDFSNNSANANILNRFNEMNTQNQNQAQQYNLGNTQSVANANVSNANQAQQYNNQLTQQQYQDQVQKTQGQTGANTTAAGGYAAENAANSSARNANTGLAFDAFAPSMGWATPGKQAQNNQGY